MRKYAFISVYTTIQQIESFIHDSLIEQEVRWKMGVPLPDYIQHWIKKKKTYLPTFSARDNFSFYERKKISLKTTPQFNITDISKNLLQAFENQEEQESLYCFESGRGKLVYQEYTYILWCFFVIV